MQNRPSIPRPRSGQGQAGDVRARPVPDAKRPGLSLADFWRRLDP